MIDECYEQAIEEAKRVDDAIEKALRAPNDPESVSLLSKPLLGIPITGKDCGAIKGLRFTAGVPGRKNVVADEDSTLAKMLRDAGGIPICMTNVPECLIFWDTFNKSFGRTHNPYNKNAIPGGSSGGLGALIASGASLIGLGSDIGGSIRMPAGFCGLYGHCCSVESVPIDHHWPPCAPSRKKMLSYGPITRYVQDIRSLLRVYTSQSEHNFNFDKPVVDMKKLKVYYLLEINDESLTKTDEEIKKGIMRVVDKLRSEGAEVREAKIKSFDSAFELWMYKMRAKDANPLAFEMNNREGLVNLYTELAKCLVGLSSHTLAVITTAIYQDLAASLTKDTQQLERNYQALFQEVADLLDDDSVLILPSHPEIEVKPPGCYLKFKNTCYTGVFNTLRLTMTQVPIGLSKKGHPMGMQIIGKTVAFLFSLFTLFVLQVNI